MENRIRSIHQSESTLQADFVECHASFIETVGELSEAGFVEVVRVQGAGDDEYGWLARTPCDGPDRRGETLYGVEEADGGLHVSCLNCKTYQAKNGYVYYLKDSE